MVSSVASAVDKLLDGMVLSAEGEAKAAIARALARQLDQASSAESGAMAMATAGIAKELRGVVDAIVEATSADDEFVHGLFAEVGDPANT